MRIVIVMIAALLLGFVATRVSATTYGEDPFPGAAGLGDGGFIDPTALHSRDGGTSVTGGNFSTWSATFKNLTTWDTAAGANATANETGINRQTAQYTISASPLAVDGGMTVSGTLAVTGATTAAAITTTGQQANTLVATSGTGYVDVTTATGASIYQHQASTGSYKCYQAWKTDGVTEFVCISVSAGGGASPAINWVGGTNTAQAYLTNAGILAFDTATVRQFTIGSSLLNMTGAITASTTITAANLNFSSTCTGTVATNAVTCSGSSGVITDDGTDIGASTSRAAITLTNTKIAAGSVVIWSMCSTPDSGAFVVGSTAAGSGTATITFRNVGLSAQTSTEKMCFIVTN